MNPPQYVVDSAFYNIKSNTTLSILTKSLNLKIEDLRTK